MMEVERIIRINIYLILIAAAFSQITAYLLVGILFTLVIIFNRTNFIFNKIGKDKPLLILIALVTITSVLSELWYVSMIFAGIFFVKILFSQVVSVYLRDKDVKNVFIILSLSGIIVSIIGLLQMVLGTFDMPVSWVDSEIYQVNFRVFSTFSNPNILAGFLNLVIIIGLITVMYHKEKAMMVLGTMGMSVSIIALLFTYSRGGWISLCLALIIASLFEKRFIKYSLLLIVLFLSFDYFNGVGRLVPDNILKDSSISYRFEIWIASIKIFLENYLFGIGSGTSWYYVHQYSSVINTYIRHSHNLYLQGLIDVGIIGFTSYSVFFWAIWQKIKSNFFNPSPLGRLNTVSFIFLISLLFFGLIDVISLHLQLSVYIWFLIGSSKLSGKAQ